MFKAILSDDLPRNRLLTVLLVVLLAYLLTAPFLFSGARAVNTAATIAIFTIFVASFDLLIGYCGIVSFAHAMFYGMGAYGTAIALSRMGPGWDAVLIGGGAGVVLAAVSALLISLISLRVQAIFYTMSTLAVASAFGALVLRKSNITGGDDGLTFDVPAALSHTARPFGGSMFGTTFTGQELTYYVVLAVAALMFLFMLRLVNSRFGRVLEAIRENDFRAEALGYRTLHYRLFINCIAAVIAAVAGVLMALWLRYVGPQSVGFNVMLNILLMVVIGGLGTIYGAIVGVVIFVVCENYLQMLLRAVHDTLPEIPVISPLLEPDRWLLFFGLVFVLAVYFFPNGLVGRLRQFTEGRQHRAARNSQAAQPGRTPT